jgi:hypothetical protein
MRVGSPVLFHLHFEKVTSLAGQLLTHQAFDVLNNSGSGSRPAVTAPVTAAAAARRVFMVDLPLRTA